MGKEAPTGPDCALDASARASLEALRMPRRSDTLDALFRARAARSGDTPFLSVLGRSATWREVDVAVDLWCKRLAAAGCRPGDRIAAALPNGGTIVELLLACARARWVLSPLDPALTTRELAAALAVLRPTVVVTTDAGASSVSAALREAAQPARIVPASANRDMRAGLPTDGAAVTVQAAMPVSQPDDPVAIVFTSGTTGTPKGAVHIQRTYVTAAEIAAWRMRLSPADTLLVVLPLFHLNALFYSVGGAIASGARLVIEERFAASTFWRTVERHGVTQVNMIAAVGNILLKRDRAEFCGNATLRKVSAAPVSAQVAEQLHDAFGITHVVESYGMTEAPGIAQVDFDDTTRRACLGRPVSHPLTGAPVSEIRVVDDARRPVPVGKAGRIMVRCTTMMRGYFNRPDLADAVDPDGWFLTEDLGVLDHDGYCWFRGRTAELIRCRGENVAASEVEAVLLTHPAVSEAACVGVPSELGEEDIVAAVVLRPGTAIDPAGLAAHCDGRLAPHKHPRWLVVRPALPKTPTEKVARHTLRADPGLLEGARRC
jgi:crotonobetaine/carnitine-CoA ligase